MSYQGWKGVDLDGTLAFHEVWKGIDHVGAPIPKMVDRVKAWLANGEKVKIFTARVSSVGKSSPDEMVRCRAAIEAWCLKHIGQVLEITCEKDMAMTELWDDRCKQVIPNLGISVEDQLNVILRGFSDRNSLMLGAQKDVSMSVLVNEN